ncbi:MAG: glycosyltransferase family 9 protein [bacterium]
MNKHKDLLIFGPNYIGDVLMMTPAIHALKLKFPESRLTVVVSKNASDVLRRNPDIWKIVETEKTNGIRGIINVFKLFAALNAIKKNNRHKFYVCVNFLTSLKFSVLGFLLAQKQVGRKKLLNNFFLSDGIRFDAGLDKSLNNVDKSLKLIEPFYINGGIKYFNRNYVYNIEAADIKNAKNILNNSFNGYGINISEGNFKFALFSPGSTRKSKEADPRLFSLFADYLNKNGFYVVITGSGNDKQTSKKIYDQIENKHMSINLTGLTDLYTLGGLLSESSLAVSVDNGTMHLSSAIGTPVIALFGSTDPAVCGPTSDNVYIVNKKTGCFHCFNRDCQTEGFGINGYPDCMGYINLEDLTAGFNSLLRLNFIKI